MPAEIQRIAELVSNFVDQRVENPAQGEVDSWIEAVCACLFTVTFWTLPLIPAKGKGDEEYEKNVNKLLDGMADSSSRWMERRIKGGEGYPVELTGIEIDLRQYIKQSMDAYLGEADAYMERHGCEAETADIARAHACFVGLSSAIKGLVLKGFPVSPQLAEHFIQESMQVCDSMGRDIREAMRIVEDPREKT